MSNLFTIYSPKGEKFEVTSLNYRDLKENAGWTDFPPNGVVQEVAAETVEAVTDTDTAVVTPVVETPVVETVAEEVAETKPEEVVEETVTEDEEETPAEETVAEKEVVETPPADEAPKARLTVEDFADLETKEAVFAYIEQTFPGNKVDGRANRDKLITLAIKLAAPAE